MDIKTITVVGANGTMGCNVAGIFAAFGNAQVYMISRSMEKSQQAIARAVKTVRADSIAAKFVPADYSMLRECVSKSDLVFESVAEDLQIKLEITKKIGLAARPDAILSTGTSGLSITTLAEACPENMRSRYFGVHMFNPPYNLILCEVMRTKYSDEKVFQELWEYLDKKLHRALVEVKDSPAFLGNRIGFQFMNRALQVAELYKDKGGVDYIDAILGSFSGRSMAPIVTVDFVGLDVHKAIVDNVHDNARDYANDTFVLSGYMQKLIDEGKLGRKAKGGLYKQVINENGAKSMMIYDIATGEYRDMRKYDMPFANEMRHALRNGDYQKAFLTLINTRSQESDLCLNFMLQYILYSLFAAHEVGFSVHAADVVMATGFNWCPPLAMAEALSTVTDLKALIMERVDSAVLENLDVEDLLAGIEPSKYDYRPFFKAN